MDDFIYLVSDFVRYNPAKSIYIALAIAAFFLIVSLLPSKRRRKRNPRFKHNLNVAKSKRILKKLNTIDSAGAKLAYLRKIDAYVFEELLLTAFKKKGWKIERNKSYSGDGGIDGIVYISGRKHLVQAKRYSGHINAQHIREFSEVCRVRKARGLFIHTGKTGALSKELTPETINIISGDKLIDLISL